MSALIIVDPQLDFVVPAGNLSAPAGEMYIPKINEAIQARHWDLVVKTRDAHTADHCSFQEQGGRWPVHCVVGTPGYDFHSQLLPVPGEIFIDKGKTRDKDSYSGFGSRVRSPDGEDTGLHDILRNAGISSVYVCGYVTEVCVKDTLEDSLDLGFETHALPEATCPFDAQAQDSIFNQLKKAGVLIDTIEGLKRP